MPSLDFNEMARIDDESKQPAPAGRYTIAVEKGEWKTAKKSGAPMVQLLLRVDEGPFKGKPVFNYLTFDTSNAPAIGMARNFLNMCGLDFGDWANLNDQQRIDSLIGKRLEVDLKVDEWEGRKSNKITKLHRGVTGPGSSGGFTPPPAVPQEGGPAAPKNPLAI